MKRLLLLGGGHAHLQVLHAFGEARPEAAEVTLLTPFADFTYSGMVPGFIAGHYELAECQLALASLAARAGVTLLEGRATAIDAAARRVTRLRSDGVVETLPYDVLSIDTGPEIDRDAIAGARQYACFVRPIEDFTRAFAHPSSALPHASSRPTHPSSCWPPRLAAVRCVGRELVVVGGGAGGVEIALALQHRLRGAAHITLLTGGGPPLAAQPAGLQGRVLRALRRRGVSVLDDACSAVGVDHLLLASGARLACDAALLAIGSSAPAWLADSGLSLDAHGFITTAPTLQSLSHPEVYAVGDVASRPDAPRPRSGVYAVRAGPPLARNLRLALAGAPLPPYEPQRRSLNLLSCGDRYAIASWGRWSLEGRWVWRWKDRIDRGFVARYRRGASVTRSA